MATSNISKRVAEEKPSIGGLDSQNEEVMERLKAIEEAEKRVEETAIPEGKRMFIEKSVRLDRHNLRRYMVKLTPSMCKVKECNFDAAVEARYTGWDDERLHPEQVLPNGQTVEEALMRLLQHHEQTAHAV